MYIYINSHPKIDRIFGISNKNQKMKIESENGSRIRVDDCKKKGPCSTELHVWGHKKLLLCSCIWFWHAKFTPNLPRKMRHLACDLVPHCMFGPSFFKIPDFFLFQDD